jgi:hypothetical protein
MTPNRRNDGSHGEKIPHAQDTETQAQTSPRRQPDGSCRRGEADRRETGERDQEALGRNQFAVHEKHSFAAYTINLAEDSYVLSKRENLNFVSPLAREPEFNLFIAVESDRIRLKFYGKCHIRKVGIALPYIGDRARHFYPFADIRFGKAIPLEIRNPLAEAHQILGGHVNNLPSITGIRRRVFGYRRFHRNRINENEIARNNYRREKSNDSREN